MSKKFTFKDTKTYKTVYEVIVPNHVSENEVCNNMIRDTGIDPRISLHIIKSIKSVVDGEGDKKLKKTKKRYKKKK